MKETDILAIDRTPSGKAHPLLAPKPRASEVGYSLLRDMFLDLRLLPGAVINGPSLSVDLASDGLPYAKRSRALP